MIILNNKNYNFIWFKLINGLAKYLESTKDATLLTIFTNKSKTIIIIIALPHYNIQSECWRIVLQINHDKVVKTVIMELCKMQQLCG